MFNYLHIRLIFLLILEFSKRFLWLLFELMNLFPIVTFTILSMSHAFHLYSVNIGTEIWLRNLTFCQIIPIKVHWKFGIIFFFFWLKEIIIFIDPSRCRNSRLERTNSVHLSPPSTIVVVGMRIQLTNLINLLQSNPIQSFELVFN